MPNACFACIRRVKASYKTSERCFGRARHFCVCLQDACRYFMPLLGLFATFFSWTTNLQAGFAQLRNCTILSHITCLALLLSLNSLLWASYEVHISCTLFHHVASLADTKSAVAGRIEPLHTPRNTDPEAGGCGARPGIVSCFGICPCNLAALCAKAPHFVRITNPKASKGDRVASNHKSLLLNEHPKTWYLRLSPP